MTHPISVFPISAIAVTAILLLSGCNQSTFTQRQLDQLSANQPNAFTDIYGKPLPNVLPKDVAVSNSSAE